jgi:hypothetical protein
MALVILAGTCLSTRLYNVCVVVDERMAIHLCMQLSAYVHV